MCVFKLLSMQLDIETGSVQVFLFFPVGGEEVQRLAPPREVTCKQNTGSKLFLGNPFTPLGLIDTPPVPNSDLARNAKWCEAKSRANSRQCFSVSFVHGSLSWSN